MSIWNTLNTTTPRVVVSDGFKWGTFNEIFFNYTLMGTTDDDSLETMTKYGWGLIAPATLSKWEE